MGIAEDLAELLPSRQAKADKDDRPVYYLWVFDPETRKVHIEHNEDKHPAQAVTHDELAEHVTHPDRVEGFAYSIKGGWRITEFGDDAREHEIEDAYVKRRVEDALAGAEPPAPLPHIRYHGPA